MTPTAMLLVALVAALCAMGLLMVLSASAVKSLDTGGTPYRFFTKQALFVGMGAVAMWVMSRFDHRRLRELALPLVGVSFGLLFLLAIPGNPLAVTVNGSRRWLGVGLCSSSPPSWPRSPSSSSPPTCSPTGAIRWATRCAPFGR
jgi:cell division protein FtsW